MSKINWKKSLYYFIWLLVIGLLVYSRFINLGWGLPYPMHPDERNMANAVQQLHCEIPHLRECFNPHFFAYGQFPLYISYLSIQIYHFFNGRFGQPINFVEAAMTLRILSAISSIITTVVLLQMIRLLTDRDKKNKFSILFTLFSLLIIVFSPILIQFAHFGTTESLLILFYSSIIYLSLLFIQKRLLTFNYLLLTSLISGFALATKVSSLLYLFIPCIVLFQLMKKKSFYCIALFLFLSALFFMLFSPHTFISFKEFISALQYESGVALGQPMVFYTRQFDHTVPIIFQITKIFPYALGWPVLLLGGLGMLGLSWKKKEYNLLRIAFLVAFLPNAFMYAKWTRFMVPTFPVLIIFAVLFLLRIKIIRIIKVIMIIIMVFPGIAYLSIYQNPDVRFQATNWINKNIPVGAKILSETANVVDIPLDNKGYRVIPFNFYDLDADKHLQEDLGNLIQDAEYIIVPSRRIFKNHPQEKYPILYEYYRRLFSGTLGFKQIAEFTSYPKLNFLPILSGFNFQMEFPDEGAEETWTVFDHPAIRIYKKEPTFVR